MPKSSESIPLLERPERVVSVDALRGFDMFWILGADALVNAIGRVNSSRPVALVVEQMEHEPWTGFHFYDLIFPMFVFIVGVSLVFSLTKTIAAGGTGAAMRRLLFRSVSLFLLGIVYNGGLSKPWPDVRLLGVLQRIALAYLAAGLLFVFFRPRTLVIIAIASLLLYWGLMALVPVPGIGRGNFAEARNLSDYIDRIALPGRRYVGDKFALPGRHSIGDHDPEGILSTLPAVVTCLLGVFAGLLLKSGSGPGKKVAILLLGGALGVGLGMAWGGMLPPVSHTEFLAPLKFPVVKKIWTSSFVLVAGGYSAVLLGLFYLIVDVWKLRLVALPFIWIGTNAITLYLVHGIFKFPDLAKRFVGGSVAHKLGEDYAAVTNAAVALLLVLLLARLLFKRSVFLRL